MTDIANPVSRRATLGVFGAVGAAALTSPVLGASASPNQASLEQAVERLRVAMLAGDGATLTALLHDQLVYMHSSGHSQSKAQLMNDLAGKQFFAGLTFSGQTVGVVERTGTVTHTVDQVKTLPGGKTRASQIKVLQTWIFTGGGWRLLSRVSAIISSPLTQAACAPRPTSTTP